MAPKPIPVRQLLSHLSALPPDARVIGGPDGHPLLTIQRSCRRTGVPVHEVLVTRGATVQIVTQNRCDPDLDARRALVLAVQVARERGVTRRELLSTLSSGEDDDISLTCKDLEWLRAKLGCDKGDGEGGNREGGVKVQVLP